MALTLPPRYSNNWFNKARAYDHSIKWREVAMCLRAFLECEPPQATNLIAQARQRLRELER